MTIEAYPSPNGVLTSLIWRKTASGGETSLSGYDNSSQALSYTPGQEQVYLNGILLVRGDDYTATNGTSITGLTALTANDYVQVNCYNNFSLASLPSTSITGTIANSQLANSTISGISLGSNLSTLTIGTGLSGTSYNGSSAVTIANTGVLSVNGSTGALTNVVLTDAANTITAASASTKPLILKGAASQSANYLEVQNSSGTAVAYINSNGSFITTDSITASGSIVTTNGLYANTGYIGAEISAKPFLSTIVGIIVRGATSQSANLQEWQNSSASVLAQVDAYGSASFGGNNTYGSSIGVGVAGSASQKGITIRGTTSQTADLQQWQNSSGTVLSKVDASGYGYFLQGQATPTFSSNAYTLVSTDAGQLLLASNSSTAGTVYVPTDATYNFPIGTQITILQTGSGQLTVSAATPATTTINSTGATAASPKCRVQFSAMTLWKSAANTWYAFGDIA
jgi:hypothetical protein